MPSPGKILAAFLTLLAALNVVFGSIPGTSAPQRFRWRSDKISLSVSRSLVTPNSNITTGSDVVGSIRRSLEAWNAVGNVDIVAVESEAASASPAGPEGDGVSVITIAATPENILMFERTDEAVAAKTRVFYNRRGFITEADIVLNPFQQFSTDGSYGTFDLETVIKHELGHLLGLGHSNVAGSLMYDSTAKNGVFGGPETIARDISTDDIASIRDLYPEPNDESCCGVISGRFTGSGRQARSAELWAEDVDSGDVVAHSVTSRDGNFRFGGVSAGTYRIFVRPVSKLRDFSVVDLGEITVEPGETRRLTRRLNTRPRNFSIHALGLNGVLGDSNIQLNPGETYTVFLGGSGLSADSVLLKINSGFIKMEPESITDVVYETPGTTLSFRITVDAMTPSGNYSICGVDSYGAMDCIAGGITIISLAKAKLPPDLQN